MHLLFEQGYEMVLSFTLSLALIFLFNTSWILLAFSIHTMGSIVSSLYTNRDIIDTLQIIDEVM